MRGTGTFADLLAQRFRVACKRLGLTQGEGTAGGRTDLFRPPEKTRRSGPAPAGNQFELF